MGGSRIGPIKNIKQKGIRAFDCFFAFSTTRPCSTYLSPIGSH